jgi:hypothetical protein
MNFKVNNDADACGTGLMDYVTAPYSKLRELLGEPGRSDGYKVSTEWVFESDDGAVITLYDYKETDLYDTGLPSVEQFRAKPQHQWHIGGNNHIRALDFKHWLMRQL